MKHMSIGTERVHANAQVSGTTKSDRNFGHGFVGPVYDLFKKRTINSVCDVCLDQPDVF